MRLHDTELAILLVVLEEAVYGTARELRNEMEVQIIDRLIKKVMNEEKARYERARARGIATSR